MMNEKFVLQGVHDKPFGATRIMLRSETGVVCTIDFPVISAEDKKLITVSSENVVFMFKKILDNPSIEEMSEEDKIKMEDEMKLKEVTDTQVGSSQFSENKIQE